MLMNCLGRLRATATAGLLLLVCGCAYNPPTAWERGSLVKPGMQWGRDVLESALQEHTYFSKEAASGGASVGGGGCGCN